MCDARRVSVDPAAVVETAIEHLRARGERITPQRRALLDALARAPQHPSADDLVELVGDTGAAHRATVYRTLDSLVRAGVVAHVHLPHGAATYHLVGGDHRPHAHLLCQGCAQIIDVPGLLDDVAAVLEAERGFRLDREHVALTGWCESCRPM